MNKMLSFILGSSAVLLAVSACGTAAQTSSRPSLQTLQPSIRATALPAVAAVSAPTCNSPAAPTIAETEGPFFKANSPERNVLFETGMPGTRLDLSGSVLTVDCKPVAHALLDFWQADADGRYDNSGYTLRGHQYTDSNGRYRLTTVIPGLYPGRTEHIHVKVQAPNGPVLTTQLFFPGVASNDSDGFFDPHLLISLQTGSQGATGTFDFVVNTP